MARAGAEPEFVLVDTGVSMAVSMQVDEKASLLPGNFPSAQRGQVARGCESASS